MSTGNLCVRVLYSDMKTVKHGIISACSASHVINKLNSMQGWRHIMSAPGLLSATLSLDYMSRLTLHTL